MRRKITATPSGSHRPPSHRKKSPNDSGSKHRLSLASKELWTLQTRYRRMFDATKDGVLMLDAYTGEITDANRPFLKMIKKTRSAVCGRKLWNVKLFENDSDAKRAFAAMKQQRTFKFENVAVEAGDGARFAAVLFGSSYRIGEEKIIQCSLRSVLSQEPVPSISKDTDRPTSREGLHEFRSRLHQTLGRVGTVKQILQRSVDVVANHFKIPLVRIWLLESAEKSPLEDRAVSGPDDTHSRIRATIGHGLSQRVIEGSRPYLSNSLLQDLEGEEAVWARGRELKSYAGMPLFVGNRMIGVFEFFLDAQLSEPTISTLAAATISIAQAINRRRGEELLRESEERYRALINSSEDAILLTSPEGGVLSANPAACRMFGKSEAEIRLGGREGVVDVSDPRLQKALNERRRSGRFKGELTFVRADGQRFPGEVSSAVFIDRNGEQRTSMIIRDITDRKHAEDLIRESEERYRVLVEGSPDAIAIHRDGKFVYVNPAGCALLGVSSPAQLVGKSILDMVHPGSRPEVERRLNRMKSGGPEPSLEEKLVRLDGSTIDAEVTAIPFIDEGRFAVQVIARDITDRKRAETKLLAAKEFAENLIEAANTLVIGLTVDGRINVFNQAAEKITGYAQAEVVNRDYFEILVPRERYPVVWHEFQNLRLGAGPRRFQNPIITKAGEERFIDWSNSVVRESGEIIGTISFGLDVTERRRAEEEIRKSEELLRKTFAGLHEAVLILSSDPVRILDCNPAASVVFGYSREELLRRDPSMMLVGDQSLGELRTELYRSVMEKDHLLLPEITMKRKSGELFPCELTVYPIEDEPGNRIGWVGVVRDISERKRAEQALQESEEMYRTLVETADDTIVLTDLEGWHLYRNSAYHRSLGYDAGENLGKDGFEIVHDDDLPAMKSKLREIVEKGTISSEYRVRHRDGRWIQRYAKSTLVRDAEGRPKAILSVIRDISERKRAEEAVRAAYSYARGLIEASLDPLVTISMEGKITDVNKATEEVTGLSRELLIGSDFSSYFTSPEQAQAGFKRVLSGGSVRDYPLTIRHRSGGTTDVLYHATVYRDPAGHTQGVFAAARDNTEQKRAQELSDRAREVMKQMNEKLAKAQSIAHVGSWEDTLSTKELHWSEEMYRILGFPLNSTVRLDDIERCFPPEERKRFLHATKASIELGRPYSEDYKFVRPGGDVRYIHDEGEVIRDRNGEPVLMVGTTQDITERKLTEQQLEASKNQLRALSAHMERVREEERKHISQEFHDQLGQTLTALKMDMSLLQRDLGDETKPVSRTALRDELGGMQEAIDGGIRIVREIMAELRPELLDQLGLVPTLEWEGEKFQRRSGIEFLMASNLEEVRLDASRSIALFRIFQEALTNVARHANASRVNCSIVTSEGRLTLEVKDNGIGIGPGSEDRSGSFGLIGMRERALLLGGSLEIRGTPGRGTTIVVTMPYEQARFEGGVS